MVFDGIDSIFIKRGRKRCVKRIESGDKIKKSSLNSNFLRIRRWFMYIFNKGFFFSIFHWKTINIDKNSDENTVIEVNNGLD